MAGGDTCTRLLPCTQLSEKRISKRTLWPEHHAFPVSCLNLLAFNSKKHFVEPGHENCLLPICHMLGKLALAGCLVSSRIQHIILLHERTVHCAAPVARVYR